MGLVSQTKVKLSLVLNCNLNADTFFSLDLICVCVFGSYFPTKISFFGLKL